MLYEKDGTKIFVMSNGPYVDILAKSEPRCHCYSFRKGEGIPVIRKNVKVLLERTGKGDCKELIKSVLADEAVARSYEVSKYAMSSRNSHYSLCVQAYFSKGRLTSITYSGDPQMEAIRMLVGCLADKSR